MNESKRIARFEKVSKEQFYSAYEKNDQEQVYEQIQLPKRATKGSAGYDFLRRLILC